MVCQWATHALASIAKCAPSMGESQGAEFRALIVPCLRVASSLCLSEPPPNVHTAVALAQLSTMLMAALHSPVGEDVRTAPEKRKQLVTQVERCCAVNGAAFALMPTARVQAEVLRHSSAVLQ